jgi:RimJ/RimL family protein N-acetyltransferase
VFAPALPIATERLILRPFAPGDLDALVAIHGDERVVRYLYWGARDRAALAGVLDEKARRTRLERENDALNLAAVLPETGALVADLTLIWTSEEHRQGEVGYILHPAHEGRGYATEGARAMLALGFEGLGLHRIAGRLDGRNAASARVLERLGMRREAHLVENERVKGVWTDEVVYALLAREWLTRAGGGSAP